MLAWLIGLLLAAVLVLWFWTTQPLLLRPPSGGKAWAADPARLEAMTRRLVGEFFPRDIEHPENLSLAAAWIASELRAFGARVSEQEFFVGSTRYRNVLAVFGPDTSDVVVVGAHYDTAGELPGADDNASGVAGLLELARHLSGIRLATRLELVAYALEEMPVFGTGLMGSAVHARDLRKSRARVRGMICLEMIGCFRDEPGSQLFPFPLLRLFYPGRGDFIAVVGNLGGARLVRRVKRAMSEGEIPVFSINAPSLVPGVDLSDHASYWREGFPAVMITDTAFYRNERYHTENDTPDTLDYKRMAQAVASVFRAVTDLAGISG